MMFLTTKKILIENFSNNFAHMVLKYCFLFVKNSTELKKRKQMQNEKLIMQTFEIK